MKKRFESLLFVGRFQPFHCGHGETLKQDTFQAECESLRKDAGRYRWLRSVSTFNGDYLPIGFWDKLGAEVDEEFDARIDAAMREGEK